MPYNLETATVHKKKHHQTTCTCTGWLDEHGGAFLTHTLRQTTS